MDGSVSVYEGSDQLSQRSPRKERVRASILRIDLLKIAYDLLLPWDMLSLGATGIACDAVCSLFFGGGDVVGGLHEETLQLTCLGPMLAPFVMRNLARPPTHAPAATSELLMHSARQMLILGAMLLVIGLVMLGAGRLPRVWLGAWLVSTFIAVLGGRVLYLAATHLIARRGVAWDRVAVVGSGPTAQWLRRRIEDARCPGLRLVAAYEPRLETDEDLNRLADELVAMARRGAINRIALALSGAAESRTMELAHRLKVLEVEVTAFYPPRGCERAAKTQLAGLPQIVINGRPQHNWGTLGKAIEDRAVAAILLLWLSPLLAFIAAAVRLSGPGPIIFRQLRHGRNGSEFEVLKFRTMVWQGHAAASGATQTRRRDWRITTIGTILRRTSLDELPQLLNVLNGTMSLVGPRPHPVAMRTEDQLGDEIIAEYMHRHRVKPGITGWAQVNGYRGATETAEQLRKRVEHDIHYIDNWSLLFDLRILALTPVSVLFRRNNAF